MKQFYYNGTILTMEPNLYAQAVLVEDGRILAVGDETELRPQATDAQPVNLDGACMLPAFIDPHSHFSATANSFLQVSLEETISFSQICERIRSFIQSNRIPAGSWVIASGYDHNQLQEKRHPLRAILDEAAPEHPLMLQHKSGHVGVFNTLALQLLHVDGNTPAPDGGRIEKDHGVPTGYMEENAFLFYQKQVPMPSLDDLLEGCRKAQERYASYGISTVQEGMLPTQLVPIYQKLMVDRLLDLDVVGYADYQACDTVFAAFPHAHGQYDRHFKLGGLKIFLDGSPQGRTAWMREPYLGGDGKYSGYPTMSDRQVLDAVLYAAGHRLQLLAHCNGDAAAAQYLSALQTAADSGHPLADMRPVMIHAQLLGRDQLQLVKNLGVIPSFFVAHVYHWGDIHLENFGPERANHISPANSALNQGIRFTFHQDAPVIAPDMLETVWCAANRLTKSGVLLGADERISVLEAFHAVTINAAFQYFEENEKGSIRPGKKADFVILGTHDPLALPADDIRDIPVLGTIKAGKWVYRR